MEMGNLTRRARWPLFVLLAACVGCESEPTVAETSGWREIEVVAPGPVLAAVLDLTGVGIASVPGGDIFYDRSPGSDRAIVVLHEPGDIRVRVVPPLNWDGTLGATLVEVADGNAHVPTSLDGYEVRIHE